MASTLGLTRSVACNLVFSLSTLFVPQGFAETHGGGTGRDSTCWLGLVPEGTDPCGLMEKAQSLLVRLSPPVERYVRELAAGLDIERSLRVQQSLLREHLTWLDEDLTKRQLDVMVFLTVALSLDRAQARVSELHRIVEQGSELEPERRLQNVELYRSQALSLLSRLFPGIEDISEQELRILL